MRSLLLYLLAAAAVVAGVRFGFPQWFVGEAELTDDAPSRGGPPPVVVSRVVLGPMQDALEALGTVRANESVMLTAPRADRVVAIHFEDGQSVQKGDLLVELHADEETAELAETEALLAERRTAYERRTDLFNKGVDSQGQLDTAKSLLAAAEARAERLRSAIADHRVVAPFAGVLGLRRISLGAYVQSSTVLTTLDDLATVKLDFTIPEAWIQQVRKGMQVTARSDVWPDRSFVGPVTVLDTRLDPATRSMTVRSRLANDELLLRPGMLLKVKIDRGADPVVHVAEEAVEPVGREHFVYRIDEESKVRRIPIEIGRRIAGIVEVRSGLEPGDAVVVEGIVRLRDGITVQVVSERERP